MFFELLGNLYVTLLFGVLVCAHMFSNDCSNKMVIRVTVSSPTVSDHDNAGGSCSLNKDMVNLVIMSFV